MNNRTIEPGKTITIQRNPPAPKPDEKAARFILTKPVYTMADIVLQESQAKAISEVLALAVHERKIYQTWGLEKVIKRGHGLKVNLYGVPGTGKTMAAHAIANQLQRSVLEVSYAEIESKYVGETSKNLVALFHTAEKENAVLLFDEADALLSRRVTEMNSSTDVSVNQTRSVLLKLMDGYDGIILFTTNFIKNYDPAFMRRITRHVYFGWPDTAQRRKLWEHYLVPELPHGVRINEIADQFEKVSGSDIANAVLNAAIRGASQGASVIPQEYFENAMEEIIKARGENSGEPTPIPAKTVVIETNDDKDGGL